MPRYLLFLKTTISYGSFVILLFLTWVVLTFHKGVMIAPDVPIPSNHANAQFISKEIMGIHQMILEGNAYERGFHYGRVTKPLLLEGEKSLISQFNDLISNRLFQRLFVVGLIQWFSGIEKAFEPWMLQEMLGVSLSTSQKFNYLADPFTRQIAYHGLHEVGQSLIDYRVIPTAACTFVGALFNKTWIIGRNFDFEAGRFFDLEKIVKWVFPNEEIDSSPSIPFVSIAWPGMVGVVTGMNAKGIYVSINAAGSSDSTRMGLPSSLLALKVLQLADSIEKAVDILTKTKMLGTDLFVIADANTQKIVHFEKSPKHTQWMHHETSFAITNHLTHDQWEHDKINQRRMKQGTTLQRMARANELLKQIKNYASSHKKVLQVLNILRDKKKSNQEALDLGDRRAIDALIATHSVIVDLREQKMYVSQGPSLINPFLGFDLKQSFAKKEPVMIESLPRDSDISIQQYYVHSQSR